MKWINFFEFLSGPEYGTMEAAWKGILTEADRLAEVHLKVKDDLIVGETQQIKSWQKEKYHKVRSVTGNSNAYLLYF